MPKLWDFSAGGGSRYSGYSDLPHLLQGGDLGAFLPIAVRVTPPSMEDLYLAMPELMTQSNLYVVNA